MKYWWIGKNILEILIERKLKMYRKMFEVKLLHFILIIYVYNSEVYEYK